MAVDAMVRFISVTFENFKALSKFTVTLRDLNVVVGANNSGKSTVIAAFRALESALRTARSRSAELLQDSGGHSRWGWTIPTEEMPISIENVQTDYNEDPTTVIFRLSNRNALVLYFPFGGGCFLFPDADFHGQITPTMFRRAFPVTVGAVPVLGPVEHEEEVVEPSTVRRNLATHRASRNFRNYWHYNPDGFDVFAKLVAETWPGMVLSLPETSMGEKKLELRMYCAENRMLRELYWLGFGFQIWSQLLTHIVRCSGDTLLVIDEPETYLHPDVQRRLVSIVRSIDASIILATHSSEIIAEAEPEELLMVDKTQRRAKRIGTAEEIQVVLDAIGSIQNPTLTKLAKTRRVLFLEGEDFKLLARFARKLGKTAVSEAHGFTVVPIGGFGNWKRVANTGWGIGKTLGRPLQLGIILDRDYRPDDEVESVRQQLSEQLSFVHLHTRNELENYLLIPQAMQRACDTALRARQQCKGEGVPHVDVTQLLTGCAEELRTGICGQYIGRRDQALRAARKDTATIYETLMREFDMRWAHLEEKLALCPGKALLSALNKRLQQEHSVSLSHASIVSAMRADEVPSEMVEIINGLDAFSRSAVARSEG